MNYILAIGFFIAILIITFILLIFMPKPLCYYDINKIYPELKILEYEEYFKIIVKELLTDDILNDNFNGIKLIYQNYNMQIDPDLIDTTFNILRTIPFIRTVFITSVINNSDLPKRKGSSSIANNTIRCILPIKIPGAKKTGIWTDGEIKLFQEGKLVLYDDSRENQVFNKHKRKKLYLLVIDVDRPDKIPIGISNIEHDVLF